MPNGIIIAYEVTYRRTASSKPETSNTTALVTYFTTEDNLEEDTEFFFSVRASVAPSTPEWDLVSVPRPSFVFTWGLGTETKWDLDILPLILSLHYL